LLARRLENEGAYWNRRYCLLNPRTLEFSVYLNERLRQKKGAFSLRGAALAAPSDDARGSAPSEWLFAVKAAGAEHLFAAASASDLEMWRDVLKKATA
jgi:hypothetical protein